MESKYCSKNLSDNIFKFYVEIHTRVKIFKKKWSEMVYFQSNIYNVFSMKVSRIAHQTKLISNLLRHKLRKNLKTHPLAVFKNSFLRLEHKHDTKLWTFPHSKFFNDTHVILWSIKKWHFCNFTLAYSRQRLIFTRKLGKKVSPFFG